MKELISNNTLLEALGVLYPNSSKTTLRSWLKEERVTVDGILSKHANQEVLEGQQIVVSPRKRLIGNKIPLLYEDNHLVVIDKPAGLLSVSTAFEEKETAHALIKAHYYPRKIYVVHRIDQDTSGVMLFALSEPAYEKFKQMFEHHQMERTYTAVVEGRMKEASGKWESYLYEDSNYHVRSIEDPEKGRVAITHFSIIQQSNRYTILQLQLETGRKNQIRVHCSDAGYPIVGDKKYGAVSNPIQRLCLHANLLAFQHPITKKQMHFESPLPVHFQKLISTTVV